MAIKKILDDFQNALSIAQAGIKGTLSSLRKARAKANKRTTKKKLPTRPKKKSPRKNPSDPILLARSVIEAAIGEPLTPSKKRKPRAKKK